MWILNVCGVCDIAVRDFELGNELEEIKKYTKKQISLSDNKLKRLFKEIDKMNIEDVRKLKGWIALLKEKNYQVEINELKNV